MKHRGAIIWWVNWDGTVNNHCSSWCLSRQTSKGTISLETNMFSTRFLIVWVQHLAMFYYQLGCWKSEFYWSVATSKFSSTPPSYILASSSLSPSAQGLWNCERMRTPLKMGMEWGRYADEDEDVDKEPRRVRVRMMTKLSFRKGRVLRKEEFNDEEWGWGNRQGLLRARTRMSCYNCGQLVQLH